MLTNYFGTRLRLLLLLLTVFVIGCQKESIEDLATNEEPVLSLDSERNYESRFFSIRRENSGRNSSSNTPLFSHPDLLFFLNAVRDLNNRDPFISEITKKVGYPIWGSGKIYANKDEKVALIPFAFEQENRMTAVALIRENQGRVFLDVRPREHILKGLESCQETDLAKAFNRLSQEIFMHPENEILESVGKCECEDNNVQQLDFESDCVWYLLEICDDSDNQTAFIPSILYKYPPYLDHDRDGILNSEDQDWYDFSSRFNVTEDDMRLYWEEYWNRRYEDEYGPWDDFYEDLESAYEDQWDNYSGLYEAYADALYEFYDRWGDDDRDGIPNWMDDDRDGNGQIDEYENDEDCWDGLDQDPFRKIDKTEIDLSQLRTVDCKWYYIKDCNGLIEGTDGNLPSYYRILLDDIIPCDLCDDDQYREDKQLNYVLCSEYIERMNITDNDVIELLRAESYTCPALASTDDWNRCMDEKYLEILVHIDGVNEENQDLLFDLLNLDYNFGLTFDQIQYVKNGFDLDSPKIPISDKIDWSESTEGEKITQTYWALAFIYHVYDNFNIYTEISYSLSDFFENVSGTADALIDANIDLYLFPDKTVRGERYQVYGTKLTINGIWGPYFNWAGGHQHSNANEANLDHYYFQKYNANYDGWENAVLDFIIPPSQFNRFRYD